MPNGKITVSLSFSLSKNVLNRNLTNSLQEQESDLFCFFNFQVSGLNSGPGLKITIYAANANIFGIFLHKFLKKNI